MLSHVFLYASVFVHIFITLAISAPSPRSSSETSLRPLYLFPNGTTAENLHVREDGSVLLNMLTPYAAVYYFPTAYSSPVLLYNFTDSAAAYGIAEYAPDTFAIATGTFSKYGNVTGATGIIWKVNLTSFRIGDDGNISLPASVSILANITDAGFLNGVTTLNTNTVLVADSGKGVVYTIDTETGDYNVVLNDTALAPNTTSTVKLGVNGLIKLNDTLYYTNTNKLTVGKVDLNANGTVAGPYTTIASNILVDDIEVDPSTGAVYIPSLTGNAIRHVAPNGTVTILAGSLNSTDIPGPTAIKLARSQNNLTTKLLISSSGGIEYPINGTYYEGGGLYELDIPNTLLQR